MDINGMARAYMVRNHSSEEFLLHVANVIERQLKEWNDAYEVMVMKLENYEVVVKEKEKFYHVHLNEQEIEGLQKQGPYELDRKVWREIVNQGLPIIRGTGNYIDLVLR
ncbi:hypothetical protein BTR23_17805 [Alkalihalophilus pseudofirmus]|nr:hypothetical protein BTR23_17805 [Alkalihalophilus pseudofirmus]